jgi:hypothetical protein
MSSTVRNLVLLAALIGVVCLISTADAAKNGRDQKEDNREKKFCSGEDCYEILNLNYKATKKEVTKAFRSLSKKHHPDREGGDKETFQKVATAYAVLSDENERGLYDYALDHKYEFPNAFKRRAAAGKLNVLPIIIGLFFLISLIQFFVKKSNQGTAVERILNNKNDRAKAKGLAGDRIKKSASKAEEEAILTEVIVKQLGQEPITWMDTLVGTLLTSPGSLLKIFTGMSADEKSAAICGFLNTTKEDLGEEELAKYIAAGAWDRAAFDKFVFEEKRKGSGKYKREKRMEKKRANNPSQGWNDE